MKFLIDFHTVHLWWAFLDIAPEPLSGLSALLSKEEAARAERFISDVHTRHFTAARGILRRLLGNYLAIPPEDVIIRRDRQGKPYLDNPEAAAPLCFNLSHSRGVALFGFSVNRRLGVDVERIDPGRNPEKLARRFFRPEEFRAVMAASGPARRERFFRYWTIKEAYLKAVGDGIGRLGDVAVQETPAGWRIRDAATGAAKGWTVRPVSIRAGYAGAVAFDGRPPASVSVFQVDHENFTNL
ncbi:MAG: 4'-phosphopantetheinyl transferase family protein [Desulfobacterales bacterium]